MTLRAKYEAFLAAPTLDALTGGASLHYVPTTTSINTAASIIKHLGVQEKMLKRKGDKVLEAIESAHGLSIELETTLEFVHGGGAFLPGLDDNFIADKTVTFPSIHVAHFDKYQKISQIRVYWDQGSLLKQVEVIGARARNWPIRDAKDQIRLITSSADAHTGSSAASSRRSTVSRGLDDVTITERPASSRSSASNNAMRDPHATLNLFQPRDIEQERNTSAFAQPVAPRTQSAKPPPREYSELFVGQDPGSPSPSSTASPHKERIPRKAGGGKNVPTNRLFDEGGPESTPLGVKTNSKKYNHFDFGDGEDAEETPKVSKPRPNKAKHQSQWNFEDFVTPEKTKPKVLAQAVRHFGWSDDEEETSPVHRPIVHKARPDADAHFQLTDAATPEASRMKPHIGKGRMHNKGLGLYEDHVTHTTSDNEDDNTRGGAKHPLGKGRMHNKGLGLYEDHVTHTTSDNEDDNTQGGAKRPLGKNENSKKTFGKNWDMEDESPAHAKTNGTAKIGEDRKKALEGLDAHWELGDNSPEPSSKNENVSAERGIKTGGNGMGGRKGTGAHWALGNNSPESSSKTENLETDRGIKTGGNGMGGRKGTNTSWITGGDEEEEEVKPASKPAPAAKSFWDF